LIKNSKIENEILQEELEKLQNIDDEEDPEHLEIVKKSIEKVKKKYKNTEKSIFPFSVYITNEKENEKDDNHPKTKYYLIKSHENNEVEEPSSTNKEKENSIELKDDQLCEDFIVIMRNGMKLYIELNKDIFNSMKLNEISTNLNKIIKVEIKSDEKNKEEETSTEENELFTNKTTTTLEDCLIHFQLMEKLDKQNEVFCDKCSKKTQMFTRMELFMIPRNLIICLKRFSNKLIYNKKTRIAKINSLVNFPINSLKFENYVPTELELFSVAQHSGSLTGGHYFTNVKNKGKWFGIDDNSVYPADEESLVIPESYLLFYRKKITK